MKKIILLILILFAVALGYGCAQSPVASTTASIPTSLCGVSLGMTEVQVIGAKGTESSREVNSLDSSIVDLYYDGTLTDIQIFSTGVNTITTYATGYTINGFGIGDSIGSVRTIMGDPTTSGAMVGGPYVGGTFLQYGEHDLLGTTTYLYLVFNSSDKLVKIVLGK